MSPSKEISNIPDNVWKEISNKVAIEKKRRSVFSKITVEQIKSFRNSFNRTSLAEGSVQHLNDAS